jgi:hypothetical protein
MVMGTKKSTIIIRKIIGLADMVMGRKKVALALKYIPSGSRVIGLTCPTVLGGLGQIEGQTVYIELMTWQSYYGWNTFRHLVR